MKAVIFIVVCLIPLTVVSQIDTISISVSHIDTSQPFYDYYTFDSTFTRDHNLIILKQLWIDKSDSVAKRMLQQKVYHNVAIRQLGPPKHLVNGDTIIMDGHTRIKTRQYSEGQLIKDKSGNKIKNKEPQKPPVRIYFYELKEILK